MQAARPTAGPAHHGRAEFWSRLLAATVAAVFGLALFRIWTALCFFAGQEWNDVRLRAAFLIADGLPLYPGLGAGPITTWIYGPAMPLLLLPVTLAPDIGSALLLAGSANALGQVAALAFACLAWPTPADQTWSRRHRLAAFALSLVILPEAFFLFLQADNAVLACGLVSLTCFARAQEEERQLWWWLAAFFAVAAAFAKLHGFAVGAGEILWLWLTPPRAQMSRFAGRLLVAGGFWVAITLAVSTSVASAWEATVTIPSRLPFSAEWWERMPPLAPYYLLMVALPAAATVYLARKRELRRSGLGLPVVVWLLSLPLGIVGTQTIGGSCNSLHAAFFLWPLALIALISHPPESSRFPWLTTPATAITGLVLIVAVQGMSAARLPTSPNLFLAVDAAALAARQGDQAWLPWRPLATRYATGRHDHDEDGLYVRQLTGLFPTRAHAFGHLPPKWDRTLFQRYGMNWHVAQAMHRPAAKIHQFGGWLIFAEPEADSGVGNGPPKVHAVP